LVFWSMYLQIFVLELVLDFLTYFLFLFIIILLIYRYLTKIGISKIVIGILWLLSTAAVAVAILIACFPEQIIRARRNWDMQIMATGYKLIWTHQDRP
jgi:hypothetical protein